MSEKRRRKKSSRRKSKSKRDGSKKRKRKSSKSKKEKKEKGPDDVDNFLADLQKIRISSGRVEPVKRDEEDTAKSSSSKSKSPGGMKKVRFKDEEELATGDSFGGIDMSRQAPPARGRSGRTRGPALERRDPGFVGQGPRGRFGGMPRPMPGRGRGDPMGGPPMFQRKLPPPGTSSSFPTGGSQPPIQIPRMSLPPPVISSSDRAGGGIRSDEEGEESDEHTGDENEGRVRRRIDFSKAEQGMEHHFVNELRKIFDDVFRMAKRGGKGHKPRFPFQKMEHFFQQFYRKLMKKPIKEMNRLHSMQKKIKKERDGMKNKIRNESGDFLKKFDSQLNKIKELEEEISSRTRDGEQRVNDVVARLRHVQMKKHQYKKERNQILQEKDQVTSILSNVKEENERFSLTVEEKDKRIEELEQEMSRLHQEINDSTQTHEEYRQRTKQSRKRLKTSHRQYLRKHEELESQGQELRQHVENLEKKIDALQEGNTQLKESNDQLSEKNDRLSEANQELLRQNGEIESKYDDIIRKHSEMSGRGKKMNWKHQEIERKNAELLVRNEENARLMKELKEASEALKDTNLEKSRRLASLLEEMNHMKLNSFETIKKLKKESIQSQSQLIKLTDVYSKRTQENELRNEAIEAQLRQSRTENRNLRFTLDKAQKKYIELAKQVGTFKESHDVTSDTNERLRERLEHVTEEAQSLRGKIEISHRVWTEKINNLQREKRHLLVERNALKEKTQNLSDEIIETHKRLTEAASQANANAEMYEAQTRETQQARSQNERLRGELNKLGGVLQENKENLTNLSQQKMLLETVNSTRSADLKDQIERGSMEAEAWRERFETLNQSYKETVTQHFELKKRNEELNVEFMKSQRENQTRIGNLETRIRELVAEKREVNEKYFVANDSLQEEKRVQEGLSLRSSLTEKEKEHAELEIKRLNETLDNTIRKKEMFERKNEEFIKLIHDNNQGLNDLRKQNEGLREQITMYQSQLRQSDDEKSESEESRRKMRQQFKNEVFFRTSQNNKLIQENTRLVNDNHNLRGKITELSEILASLQKMDPKDYDEKKNELDEKRLTTIPYGEKEKQEYVELKVRNSELFGANTALVEENDRLKRDLDLVKIRFQQQLRTAKKMNSKYKKKLRKLKKETKGRKIDFNILSTPPLRKMNELGGEEELEEEIEEDDDDEEEEGEMSLIELRKELREKNTRLRKLEFEHQNHKLQAQELEKRNKIISEKYKGALQNYLELQQSFQKSIGGKDDDEGQNKQRELMLEKEQLRMKLEESKEEKRSLQENVDSLKSEVVNMSKKILDLSSIRGNNIEKKKKNMKQDVDNPFLEKYEKILVDKIALEQELKFLKIRLKEKEDLISRQKETIGNQKETLGSTSRREMKLSEESKLLEQRLEIMTETKNARIRELETKLESAKEKLREVGRDKDMYDQQKGNLKRILVENMELKNRLNREKKMSQTRNIAQDDIKQTIKKLSSIMKEDSVGEE